LHRCIKLRGGEEKATAEVEEEEKEEKPPCVVLVSTNVGSSFLDKKKRLTLAGNGTVADLKMEIQQRFPGSPPAGLQKLYFGIKKLRDEDVVSNLSALQPLPVMLDMLTGTSVYNKSMSISQALEAYASLAAQQAYIGENLRSLFMANDEKQSENQEEVGEEALQVPESAAYTSIFEAINGSIYATYAQDIAEALEEEKEPETFSADTAAWRSAKKEKQPLTMALAKEFDLNGRGLKSFAYYSILLGIFAWFGTNTQLSSKFLICCVPFLWVSKLRQLRILAKLAMYMVIPVIPHIDFLMPLLPAPLQVIAIESKKWSCSSSSGEDEEEEESPPILPRSKAAKAPIVPTSKRKVVVDIREEERIDEEEEDEPREEEEEEEEGDEEEEEEEEEEVDSEG